MLYQFLNDGSGQVIAESLNPKGEWGALQHLHFPKGDIPKAARQRLLK